MLKSKFHLSGKCKVASFLSPVFISVASIVIFSSVFAFIAILTPNPTAKIGIFSLLTLIISSVVSGAAISRKNRSSGVKRAFLTSIFVVIFLLLASVIFSGGKVSVGSYMNCLCYVGCSLFSAYIFKKR